MFYSLLKQREKVMSELRKVKPHECFRADFDAILEEGKRQERIDAHNIGEAQIVADMHTFLDQEVLPAILNNDWVFDAAQAFASKYAEECFATWKLTGDEVYAAQQKLLRLKSEVEDFLERADEFNAVRRSQQELVEEKMSNFPRIVKRYNLPLEMQAEATRLFEEVSEHEALQIRIVVRAIRENYTKILPRLMYVIRRAMVIKPSESEAQNYEDLKDISEILNWYENAADESHPLYPVFGELRALYRVIRNVANHPEDYVWNSNEDTIAFPIPNNKPLKINSRELTQKYRYLVHLCDLGMRGISLAFCEREQGPISNDLLRQYAKIFPENFPGGEEVIVTFY